MSDTATARRTMVENQIRPSNVTDPRILAALQAVPREKFVPRSKSAIAYGEGDIEFAPGRYVLDVRTLAILLKAADILPSEVTLIIGGGDGYSGAVVGHLADAVLSLEADEALVDAASASLEELGVDNVAIVTGELSEGYPDQAPYDVILVNGAAEISLEGLAEQLQDGGRLVGIEYEDGIGRARIYQRNGGVVSGRAIDDLAGPVLPGLEQPKRFAFG